MTPAEYRAVAYRTGYHFARERLRAGEDPDSVRLALRRGLEHLRALRAHSADLGGMMRRGVEDSLAGKPIDRLHALPGSARCGARLPALARMLWARCRAVAWDRLPEAVRAGIVALVRAATRG
jgi:hypothetical protein